MRRIVPLDGLRFLAFASVFMVHAASLPSWAVLWAGVDVFFVLSGFVITNNLMSLKAREPGLYFRIFYFRRVRRIFPACGLAVAASAMFFHYTWNELRWHLLLMSNFAQAFGYQVGPYLTSLWSLAIEEQFYLFWPLAVFLLSAKQMERLAILGIVAAFLLRAAFSSALKGTDVIYLLTPFRMDLLFAGALLASIWNTRRAVLYSHRRLLLLIMGLCVVVFGILTIRGGFQRSAGSFCFDTLGYSLICVFCFALVGFVATAEGTIGYRLFANRWLAYLGTISYMMYLIHPQVIHLTLGVSSNRFLSRAVAFVCIAGFASVSWHFYERPILSGTSLVVNDDPPPEHTLRLLGVIQTIIGRLSYVTRNLLT